MQRAWQCADLGDGRSRQADSLWAPVLPDVSTAPDGCAWGPVVSSVVIPLPWSNPPLSGNRTRGNPHARANEVREAKDAAYLAIKRAKVKPIVGANITLHLRIADRRRRDADNLAPTLKVCQDALVMANVLPDDSWVSVPSATCRIHPPNGEPASMWLELAVLTEYQEPA